MVPIILSILSHHTSIIFQQFLAPCTYDAGDLKQAGLCVPLGKHVAGLPQAPPTICLNVRQMFYVLQQGEGWVTQV